MSAVIAVAVFLALFALGVLRSLAVEEVRGRAHRRLRRDLEQTLAAMPPELAAEWAEEWRAELAALESMPLTAITFVRQARRSAAELAGVPALAGAKGAGGGSMIAGRLAGVRGRLGWLRRSFERLNQITIRSRPFRLLSVIASVVSAIVTLKAVSPPALIGIPMVLIFVVAGLALVIGEPRR